MPSPAVSLRLKRFRSRFGITAPKVVVRSALPRGWFFLAVVLLLLVFFLGAWLSYSGRVGESEQLAELRELMTAQQGELVLLRRAVGTGQSAVSMEKAAQQQLIARISELEAENAALKEDMLIFERLIPLSGQESVVRIENLRVIQETPVRYRYRMLLAYQAARRGALFKGAYEVQARYRDTSGEEKILAPVSRGTLEVRHFLRREEVLELPEGAHLISVEVRLSQSGKVVAEKKLDF